MDLIGFDKTYKEKLVICLGSFDGYHSGHMSLILKAQELKKALGAISAVFTFSDGSFLPSHKSGGQLFTLYEREIIAAKLGIDVMVLANGTKEFMSTSPYDFVDRLTTRFNIAAVICGEDYTFGNVNGNGVGNAQMLEVFLKPRNIPLFALPCVLDESGEKISTSLIKRQLLSGNILAANSALCLSYFIMGAVESGRGVGKQLGYATLNVKLSEYKFKIKYGVYKTRTEIDGRLYNSITNIGSAPTFNRSEVLLETHLLNFDGVVPNGTVIKVDFVDYLRDIIAFKNREELIEQLRKDEKCYD